MKTRIDIPALKHVLGLHYQNYKTILAAFSCNQARAHNPHFQFNVPLEVAIQTITRYPDELSHVRYWQENCQAEGYLFAKFGPTIVLAAPVER